MTKLMLHKLWEWELDQLADESHFLFTALRSLHVFFDVICPDDFH